MLKIVELAPSKTCIPIALERLGSVVLPSIVEFAKVVFTSSFRKYTPYVNELAILEIFISVNILFSEYPISTPVPLFVPDAFANIVIFLNRLLSDDVTLNSEFEPVYTYEFSTNESSV